MVKDKGIIAQMKKMPLGNSENIAQMLKKQFEDEIKSAKPLEKLIFPCYFNVTEVISQSYATSVEPLSEMVIGGRSSSYEAGFSSKLVLKVDSIDSKIPINTLNFRGFSIVKAGDYISALVPRYTSKSFDNHNNPMVGNETMKDTYYFDREFNKEELAIQLVIFDSLFIKGDKNILRTDRSVEYHRFKYS
ncbi:MAG: hypothetical protein WCX73_04790 [Candidatus Pacearchaeota archaeon]